MNTDTKTWPAHVLVGIKGERRLKNVYSLKFHLKNSAA